MIKYIIIYTILIMHASQNQMKLIFAKLNVNSHRAFVNVMAPDNTLGYYAKNNEKSNINKNKRKVCQYVKRLNQRSNSNKGNDICDVVYKSTPKSIEELVKRDTNERIKYNHHNNSNNSNVINGCIPYK